MIDPKNIKEVDDIVRPRNPCHLGITDVNGNTIEEIKGLCTHSEVEHDEGSCWHITQPDLEEEQTVRKFCPCGAGDGENHRRYDHPNMGFMEPGIEDYMITKKCVGCEEDVLLNIEDDKCGICKSSEMSQ